MKSLCCVKCCFGDSLSTYNCGKEDENNSTKEQTFSWDKRNENSDSYISKDLKNKYCVRRSGEINGQQYVVENCSNCTIIVKDITGSVNIDDSQDCLIILGPCNGSVFIRDCKRCQIFTICQQLRTRDCNDLSLFVFCQTQPIIEESTRIRFSPLFLNYEGLEDQLLSTSLSPFINKWNKVHDFTPLPQGSNYVTRETTDYSGFGDKLYHIKEQECIYTENNESLLPYTRTILSKEPTKKFLLVLTQEKEETIRQFYKRGLSIMKFIKMNVPQSVITDSFDIKIYKKELKLIATKNSEYLKNFSGQLLFIQILNIKKEEIEKSFENIIILDEDINEEKEHINFLYRLVNIKSSI
uniref:C-CAP/cofactor C-like domain-containing protein n=1 Tax=Strongyloides papillosus TaxID=174720 RepID=A0A0N5C8F6_STREA